VPLSLKKGNYYPIATYESFQDIDPMASVLSVLAKETSGSTVIVQFALEGAGSSWQSSGQRYAETGGGKTEEGTPIAHPDAQIIREKISCPGFLVSTRVAAENTQTINAITSAFGVYTRSEGNGFTRKKSRLFGKKESFADLLARRVTDKTVLNILELATVWHLPGEKVKTSSIAWGNSVLSETPGNLPVAAEMTDAEKQEVNFFAKAQYKNRDSVFGIKTMDRQRHVWVVGKTGTGKSTIIKNMVIDDIKKGKGVALIDPHGDAAEEMLDYVPGHRINDTIYFNPSDRDWPITINPLEVRNKQEGELVVSGLMSIFTKIWANVWSARMEYILRNTLLTLALVPNTTFADVLRILTNDAYRNHVLQTINDDSLVRFWRDEYNKMPDRLQKEAISPIQNKVGQFVTSPMIRRIIGQPKSTIHLEDVMDQGKILLCNLSQGRLGEDNSALLGATLITKIQQASMARVYRHEDDRRNFYLYVDEFQNFATTSFIKILSEARKYHLNLMLANQYMAQIPEDVQKAILGNIGTLIAFRVGAEDASVIHKEFAEVFSENDLVNIANYQIAIKLMIDNYASRPFLATTLPMPASKNQNREKVIQVSRQRWSFKERDADKGHNNQAVPPVGQEASPLYEEPKIYNANEHPAFRKVR